MLRYCSLFSGSTGNCTYIGTAEGGVLVDAGVSARRIECALRERQIAPESIRAVLVTHEHIDHVKGLQILGKKYHWPVLASQGTLECLCDGEKTDPSQPLYVLSPDTHTTVAGLRVTAFSTPHDSRECQGYRFDAPDGRAVAVCTDLGFMPDAVLDTLRGCALVHIESNHDIEMLRCGSYPYTLKRRILGDGGHLSNVACAAVLPVLAAAGTKRFVLAHISKENNTPELALQTSAAALAAAGLTVGRDVLLEAAEPESTRPVVYF